jgi:uncharacterized protein YhbP (UPF0306 family)
VTDDVRAAIGRMLAAHHTLTLATSHDGKPWSAAVFYASDAAFNLYFVSDVRTRHAREMAANPRVALAINADVDNWDDVRGLQIEGTATPVEGVERARALALYLAKFASVKALFEAPRSADEQAIAARLKATEFWRITPTYIRLIDNARGFGFRQELNL